MRRFTAVVVVASAVVLAACSPKPEGGEIPIGVILPTTGASAATGTNQQQGATLAFEEINASGGALGKKLKMLYRDDTSMASAAPPLAAELIDAGVPAILGSGPSSITLAIAALTADAGVVQISGSSTSPAISTFPSNGYLFRTVPADSFQGTLLASRAYTTHGFRTVGVVYVNSAYGNGLAAAFKAAFTAAGGTIPDAAYVQYTAAQKEADYTTLLNGVFASATKIDAILLVATVGDGTTIFKAYVDNIQATQPNTFWLFTDSTSVVDFVNGVGASAFTASNHEGTKPATPDNDNFKLFAMHYMTRFGSAPGSFAANAYDAVYLIALGLEKGGVPTGAALKSGIIGVSETGGQTFSASQFTDAVAAIKANKAVDYQGASGPCNFAPNATSGTNDLADGVYDIWQVQGGAVTVIVPSVAVK
jgi:branched-chain amino acid transport system substrate-binding protein